jgi:hypothetical protein
VIVSAGCDWVVADGAGTLAADVEVAPADGGGEDGGGAAGVAGVAAAAGAPASLAAAEVIAGRASAVVAKKAAPSSAANALPNSDFMALNVLVRALPVRVKVRRRSF